jgi:hypothetical protein
MLRESDRIVRGVVGASKFTALPQISGEEPHFGAGPGKNRLDAMSRREQ